MIKIEANDITKEYHRGKISCSAVKNISLKAETGDFISIVGKSGAGKSTLLYILSGISKPDTGSVLLDNRNLTTMRDNELSKVHGLDMGIVFQDSRLIDDLTVFDNIALPGYLYRNKADVNQDVMNSLKALELTNLKDKYPPELSAGERQRIAIARALINNPGILFLDEPTGNLDVQTGRWIHKYLQTMNKKGMTIIMVTHDIYAAAIGNHVWLLSDGHIKDEISFNGLSGDINARMKQIYNSMY